MASRRSHGEGSIFREEARNRWVGTIDVGNGVHRRRVKVTGKTKTAVRERLKVLQRQSDAGLPVAGGSLGFGEFLDQWLLHVLPARSSVKSTNTIDNYRWAVEKHLRPTLGRKTLRNLSPEDVEAVLRSMANAGLARNTVMRVRSVAAMALKHAQRRDLVARNVAELAEMPANARPVGQGRSLTVEQAGQLLEAAAGDRFGPYVTVGLMLGLRPGELCGLRWADIDTKERILTVRQARVRLRGDTGGEVLGFGDPKTEKSRRSIRLPGPATDALARQRAEQARERLVAGSAWTDNDLVFSTRMGTPMSPSNVRRDLARLTERAGLGAWHPNELRHSAASLLSAAGVPLEDVMDLLGHTDTRMLERVYRHRVTRAIEAAAPMATMFSSGS